MTNAKSTLTSGQRATVSVRAIANGFIVVEEKHDGQSYSSAESEPLFYPTMEGVERELVTRFRAAIALEVASDSGEAPF